MPLFDFHCKKCGNVEEHLVKMPDPNPFSFDFVEKIACSACGSENVQKLIGATVFHLKGSGWAKDNYGNAPNSGASSKKK